MGRIDYSEQEGIIYMKILKRFLIIFLILFIQSLCIIYRIISKLWQKYNTNVKNFVKKLDKELRAEL